MTQHYQPSPRRVAIYARYSTDMQNPKSIDDQFRISERYATQQGWVVARRFSDSAVSGTLSYGRSEFMQLTELLLTKDRGFDLVLVESLDRL